MNLSIEDISSSIIRVLKLQILLLVLDIGSDISMDFRSINSSTK